MFRAGLIAILLLALAALASCGGGMATARDTAFVPVAALDHETSIGAEDAQALLVPSGDSYTLKVIGLENATEVYGEVRYDPSVVHLARAETASGEAIEPGAFTPEGEVLMVVDQPSKGRVVFGLVVARPQERPALNGTLILSTLTFAAGPSEVTRVTAKAPAGVYNVIDLGATKNGTGNAVLTWIERLCGDGGNNGLVTINDLSPLAPWIGLPANDSVSRDADYDRNTIVTLAELTAMAPRLEDSLGGYKVMASPTPTGTFTEVADIARADEHPAPVPLGEVTWTWTSPAPLVANTSYKVVPYDNTPAKATGLESDVETLTGNPAASVVSVDSIEFDDPNAVVIDTGTELQLIITEESVDGIPGNTDPFSLEELQLRAIGEVTTDPGVPTDITNDVLWVIEDGGGLADVTNTDGARGLLTFHDRGSITVTAHKSGDFNESASITFRLLTIESIELVGPGASPFPVNSGTDVPFTVNGTFDWDDDALNGNEAVIDITEFANWALLDDAGNTGQFVIAQTAGGVNLDTDDADSGDGVRVSAEYPRTDVVLLGDNLKRVSPLFRVDVN